MRQFKDVTIYTQGNFIYPNIVRIDAAKAKIWIAPSGGKESVCVEYIERGKRKSQALTSSDPYVVVVPTTHAIHPDDLYLPPVAGVSSTRYGVTDTRWRTDFDERLLSAKIPILADYRYPLSATEAVESASGRPVNGDQLPATVSGPEPATGSKHETVDFEHEEGLRQQAERNFFKRNPQLLRQAKEQYGCICQVCRFDFSAAYGELGLHFAEGHHLNPLSERPPEEWTVSVRTNVADIAILCANCHRMIHRRRPALSIDELKAIRKSH